MRWFATLAGAVNWRTCPAAPAWTKLSMAMAGMTVAVCFSSGNAAAQAAAEYGSAVGGVGVAASGAMKSAAAALQPLHATIAGVNDAEADKTPSAHLPLRVLEDPVGDNRRALEAKAGKDAAKLMLRSAPNGASVRIDGKEVGETPLLLIVPPGAYKVEMASVQRETARKQVDLLPKETREVLLDLPSRYPTHVAVSWHRQ